MLPEFQMNRLGDYSLNQLLVAIFNMQISRFGRIEIVSTYRPSKFSNANLDYVGTAQNLQQKYALNFCYFSGDRIWVTVGDKNQRNIEDLLDVIYFELQDRLGIRSLSQAEQKEVAMALLGLRGSPDFTIKKYAVDINHDSLRQIERLQNLIRLCPSLSANTALNPKRDARRPQIRADLQWVYENFSEDISRLNSYKGEILEANKFRL